MDDTYVLKTLRSLISFPTQKGNVDAHISCAKFLKRELERIGLKGTLIQPQGTLTSCPIVIGLPNGKLRHPHIHLNGHYDVVPAGEGWSNNPYRARLTQSRIIGRGTADMKGGIAVLLGVLNDLRSTRRNLLEHLRVCLNNHFLPIGVVVEWAVG